MKYRLLIDFSQTQGYTIPKGTLSNLTADGLYSFHSETEEDGVVRNCWAEFDEKYMKGNPKMFELNLNENV